MNLKKWKGIYEQICWDRALVLWKKYLPDRGLTKFQKHWPNLFHRIFTACSLINIQAFCVILTRIYIRKSSLRKVFPVRFPVWLNVLKYSSTVTSKRIKEKQCRQSGTFTAVTSKWSLLANGKSLPITRHEGTEGQQRHSSALSLTSALDGNGSSSPRPGRFTAGKDPVHIV